MANESQLIKEWSERLDLAAQSLVRLDEAIRGTMDKPGLRQRVDEYHRDFEHSRRDQVLSEERLNAQIFILDQKVQSVLDKLKEEEKDADGKRAAEEQRRKANEDWLKKLIAGAIILFFINLILGGLNYSNSPACGGDVQAQESPSGSGDRFDETPS